MEADSVAPASKCRPADLRRLTFEQRQRRELDGFALRAELGRALRALLLGLPDRLAGKSVHFVHGWRRGGCRGHSPAGEKRGPHTSLARAYGRQTQTPRRRAPAVHPLVAEAWRASNPKLPSHPTREVNGRNRESSPGSPQARPTGHQALQNGAQPHPRSTCAQTRRPAAAATRVITSPLQIGRSVMSTK